jgi:hypothetical protein
VNLGDRICGKCGDEPARPGQRWGAQCHNAYRRSRNAEAVNGGVNSRQSRGTTKGAGGQAPGREVTGPKARWFTSTVPTWLLEEPKPFTPYRVGQPALPWYTTFLVHYATHGGKSLAAAAAGVTLREVNKRLDRDAMFRGEL